MSIWLFIIFLLIFSALTIVFLSLFYREWRHPKPNHYPKRSIRKFIKDSAVTLNILFAIFFALCVMGLIVLFIQG